MFKYNKIIENQSILKVQFLKNLNNILVKFRFRSYYQNSNIPKFVTTFESSYLSFCYFGIKKIIINLYQNIYNNNRKISAC